MENAPYMNKSLAPLTVEKVGRAIILMRGEKVILDSDLARLYGVSTARLNQQVNRNADRFPGDFMFRLREEEFKDLILQNATSNKGRGGRRKLPYVFTEHGAIMAANVLNSPRAVQASVQVVRAFIQLRQLLASSADLARKLDTLESKYDHQFKIVFDAIRQLMTPPLPKGKQIGFRAKALKK
jgi:ORF6N domain-containing protein